MKLLIVTQKVDKRDDVLGFVHEWLQAFSQRVDSLIVICLYEGVHDLPDNVKIVSLGKENGRSRLEYLSRFFRAVWKYRHVYDTVFVHMNPIYMALAGLFWKLSGKTTAMWYTHRSVDLKLRIAERFCDIIFTASAYSFQLASRKVKAVGHGISVERFHDGRPKMPPGTPLRVLSVGRITPIKNLETLVRAARIVRQKGADARYTLVGAPGEGDLAYKKKIEDLVRELGLSDLFQFAGSIPNTEMPRIYWEHDISVNLCPTGGTDKVVFESMAAGVPVFAANEAFRDYFGPHASDLMFRFQDEGDLADKILRYRSRRDTQELSRYLVSVARSRSAVGPLVDTIIARLAA